MYLINVLSPCVCIPISRDVAHPRSLHGDAFCEDSLHGDAFCEDSLHGDAFCEDSDERVPVESLENSLPLVGPQHPPHFELEVVLLRGPLEDVLK